MFGIAGPVQFGLSTAIDLGSVKYVVVSATEERSQK